MFKHINHLPFTFLLLTLAGFGSTSAYAACDGNSCTKVKVERLYVRSDPNIMISTTGDEAKLNCKAADNRYIALRDSHPKQKEIYSLLLAAKLADHDVWIRTIDAPQSACAILYVVLE